MVIRHKRVSSARSCYSRSICEGTNACNAMIELWISLYSRSLYSEIRRLHWQRCHPTIACRRPRTSDDDRGGLTLQPPPNRMNIAVLPPCHRPPVSWSPSNQNITKASLKSPRLPRAQIHRTSAGLPTQCHPSMSAATAWWFGDVFAMPHLHIRHRRCPKNSKGVVKTWDAFMRCPNFRAPPQCYCSGLPGVSPGDVCKWGCQLIGKGIARNVTTALLSYLLLPNQLIC